MLLTYRYRLLPSKAQHRRLRAALDHTRDLYNAALQERQDCYRKTGRSINYYAQSAGLTSLRQSGPEWAVYATAMQYWPLQQVALAYEAFFRRLKAGETPGYPRFKGREWFKTFGFTKGQSEGWRVRDGRLLMKGIGAIRLHLDRSLPSEPIGCKVKREGRHWYALLTVEVAIAASHDGPAIGIDMGLHHLAALSNGETIENPRPYQRAMRELRRRQRALARCRRGSGNRRKARERVAVAHAKARRTRDTYLHQVSANLCQRFSAIAVESLSIRGLAASQLARSVRDAGWGKLIDFICYKAERAGAQVIEVNPRYTSQTCPDCGVITPKRLAEREHHCPCGCVMDRDVAAAKVILHRAITRPDLAKPSAMVA